MMNIVKHVFYDSCVNKSGQFQPRLVADEVRQRLISETGFLPSSVSLKQRFYTLKENVQTWPICDNPDCEKLAVWDNYKNFYRSYCSVTCVNLSMKGERGRTRAKSRNTFKQIDAPDIQSLLQLIKRTDGNFNGNITNEKHLSPASINLIHDSIKGDYPLLTKLLFIDNGIESPPLCKQCSGEIKIIKSDDLKKEFCSALCARRNISVINKTKDVWISRHGVPTNLLVGRISTESWNSLTNDDLLIELSSNQNMNGSRIAKHIGVSVSAVCKRLQELSSQGKIQYVGTRSLLEGLVEETLAPFVSKIEYSNREIIAPFEIDLWIPESSTGIEVNGDYWHSDRFKDKNFHSNKANMADDRNIRLIQLFEHEIHNSLPIIQSMITTKSNGIIERARKCTIKPIDNKVYTKFLENNHIQGSINSSIRYGLFNQQGDILSVAGFGKPRFNTNFDWELHRYCNQKNTSVTGGFSKILKVFCQQYDGSILTYADRRFSSKHNNVYQRTGFELIRITPPSYFYVSPNGHRLSRYQTQKHKLPILLKEKYDKSLTEYENMTAANYHRIWDAGQFVYQWRKT